MQTARGTDCKAWAVHDSNPPKCAAHGGGTTSVGAPAGNDNAKTHGFYTEPKRALTNIEDIFADLAAKQLQLSNYIDNNIDALKMEDFRTLFAVHAQNASRLGRLLRDKRALSGEAADGISSAFAKALDELSTELGVDL